MAERKHLVLGANILIRACLGIRVRQLIADFASEVDFLVAEANAAEASRSIEILSARRNLDAAIGKETFLSLMEVVQVVGTTLIGITKDEAVDRIRDPTDWPALALALQPARSGADPGALRAWAVDAPGVDRRW